MNDIVKLLDSNDGINNGVADRIVKMGYVQTQITKMSDSTNGKITETELENQLKTIFLKSWADKSITDKAIEKVKKDIK